MSTRRERVITSLLHRQPDRTPYHIGFTEPARAAMAAFYGDASFEESLGNCFLLLDCSPATGWSTSGDGTWRDEFGVQWDRTIDKDIGTVCNTPVTPENVARYEFPDPHAPGRFDGWTDAIARAGDRYIAAGIGFSLFERAWTLAGMETVLMDMADEKRFVNALLDRILEFNLAVIDAACAHPVDAVRFGDDWGHQRGLIMGRALWRELIGPRVRAMYAAVHARGRRVMIHSCGKVDELFPDLIDAGVDVFNPFQPEVMDVSEMKRLHGDRLSFFGGISTQRTLPYATVTEVKDEVKRLLDTVGREGGYIASPAHDIPRDAKPENIAAMIEVLQGQ